MIADRPGIHTATDRGDYSGEFDARWSGAGLRIGELHERSTDELAPINPSSSDSDYDLRGLRLRALYLAQFEFSAVAAWNNPPLPHDRDPTPSSTCHSNDERAGSAPSS